MDFAELFWNGLKIVCAFGSWALALTLFWRLWTEEVPPYE